MNFTTDSLSNLSSEIRQRQHKLKQLVDEISINDVLTDADPEEIMSEVAKAFGIKKSEIRNGLRYQEVMFPRKTFCFIAKLAGCSYGQIGKALWHLDHTSAMLHVGNFKQHLWSFPAEQQDAALRLLDKYWKR